MRELVRRNLRFFLIFSIAALLLRLLFIFRFPGVVTDSFIYGDIAKNWLQHGIYGLSGPDEISPTYIRLPGYPAFLALIFWIAGLEHYRAVLFTQMFIDLGTCFLCADIALKLIGPRAARIAFVLACLCPFLADYSAAALTETLEVFFTVLAFDLTITALEENSLKHWAATGLACAAAILLRPDGALLLIAIGVFLFIDIFLSRQEGGRAGVLAGSQSRFHGRRVLTAGVVLVAVAILPLVPWTLRNWHVFHRFQPLAPRYANEEGEFVPMGFNRWVKTWMADYASVEEIYWQEPGAPIDPAKLPARAFDTPRERDLTFVLVGDYNQLLHVSPKLDAQFEALASSRIREHPIRYYCGLPLLRILDMWLRPRTEMLPSDSRWWEFNDEPKWSALAILFGVIGLFYAACGLVGWMRVRLFRYTSLLLLFVVLRSLFLGSLENPEPRYTLEMYPILLVFVACALTRRNPNASHEIHS
ncbi:MAG TPA: glycosyltransferase family 39 protein [Terriglobales bacterium]|nr:glycosyltransferase family 39 protein [Terriglobales bacterium]